jgi:dolichol-phosphate mannosyltransferase
MDSDLQDRPEVIPQLYKKAKEGFDVVFVSRENRPESKLYLIMQKTFYLILRNLSGIQFDPNQANFSIISKKVVESFINFSEQSRFYPSTIKWLGFTRSYIFADHGTRFSGAPAYTIRKRFKLAFEIILAFSDRPLKFAIGLGVTFSAISFLMVGFIVIRRILFGFSVIGWPSIMATLLFSSGMILVFLGINGMYISKIFAEVKKRPLFVIQKELTKK